MRRILKHSLTRLAPLVPDRLATLLFGAFCPIFMLHRLHDGSGHGQSTAHIARCLEYLRKHRYTPLTLEDAVRGLAGEAPLPDRCAVFTIDDGFEDHAVLGGPLFARYDVPLTCFVITDFLDGRLWPWDDQVAWALTQCARTRIELTLPGGDAMALELAGDTGAAIDRLQCALKQDSAHHRVYEWLPELYRAAEVSEPRGAPESFRPMGWQQARAFAASGHRIAPHTRSHRILSRLSAADSAAEIAGSLQRVVAELGAAVEIFAYPTGRVGDFGQREIESLAGLGMRAAVATMPRAATAADNALALPRFGLPDDFADFVQYLSFIEHAKETLRARRLG